MKRIDRLRQAAEDLDAAGNVAATRTVREEIARLERLMDERHMRECLDAVREATGVERDSEQQVYALIVALDHALTRWPGIESL